ncbi:MAG: hypothetical protein ACE5GJ_13225 [Gemmatimonadota bacterium]
MMMKKSLLESGRWIAVGLIVLAAAACSRGPGLETRTFALENLAPHEAEALVAPYVFDDRERNPGTMSRTGGAITVRETPDNLDKIERVMEQFDVAQPEVRLTFQLVEADGFSGTDPAIAEVEKELRKVFDFKGYRLAG